MDAAYKAAWYQKNKARITAKKKVCELLDPSIVAKKASYDREYRRKNSEKIKTAKKIWGQSDVKKEYDKQWAGENRARSNAIKRAWKERNPEHAHEYYEKKAEERLAYMREYYEKNRERELRRTRLWVKANPHKATALAGKRVEVVRRATPAWANQDKMREIYQEARQLGLEVDHVIPLQGKFVSGLHVHTNLQLLSRSENARKGARYAG